MISPGACMRLRVYGEEVTETMLHEAAGRCVSIMEIVRPRRSAWTRVLARRSALRGGGEGIQLSEAGPSTMGPVLTEGERGLFSDFEG